MDTNPIYIIPARGGSKGIPHKNIKILGGKPLIHYAIANALTLTDDDTHRRIIVSTDDARIAEVALAAAADITIRRRPEALATDTAATQDVIIDAISTRTVAKPSTDLKFKQLSTARLDTLGKCEGNNGICFVRGGAIYIGEWLEFGQ